MNPFRLLIIKTSGFGLVGLMILFFIGNISVFEYTFADKLDCAKDYEVLVIPKESTVIDTPYESHIRSEWFEKVELKEYLDDIRPNVIKEMIFIGELPSSRDMGIQYIGITQDSIPLFFTQEKFKSDDSNSFGVCEVEDYELKENKVFATYKSDVNFLGTMLSILLLFPELLLVMVLADL